jgi:DNA-binding FrmR family transcriptional regulator
MDDQRHKNNHELINKLKKIKTLLDRTIFMLEKQEDCALVSRYLQGINKGILNAKTHFIHAHIRHCLQEHISEIDEIFSHKKNENLKQIIKFL